MGLRAGLDAVARREKSFHYLCRESNPGLPARSVITVLTRTERKGINGKIC
jgi:hypothetical protein